MPWKWPAAATELLVLFVPIANPSMIHHPAVQRNVGRLQSDGYLVLPPLSGPEAATRERLELINEAFPLPTLLLRMTAVLSDPKARGIARRGIASDRV